MRKFVLALAICAPALALAQANNTTPIPASSASGGGVAAIAVVPSPSWTEIQNFILNETSVYEPAWTSYFPGQRRISTGDKELTATVGADGRLTIPVGKMPIPNGKGWSRLDKRNACGRGYVYGAFPIFTAKESFVGMRPRDWGWQVVFWEGSCV